MREILLTQGQKALVDDADYERLSKFNWCVFRRKGTFYAMRGLWLGEGKQRTLLMHRAILGLRSNQKVDHVDGNGLNNTRSNLRVATTSENGMNRGKQKNNKSGFKGVCFFARTNKWVAYIRVNRKSRNLGYFFTPEEAHAAYCAAASELHGEFARTQ